MTDPDAQKDSWLTAMGLTAVMSGRIHSQITGITDGQSLGEVRRDYIEGRIEVDEFERRIEPLLRAERP